MRGPNAARGKHIGVTRPQGVHGSNNIALVVSHTARLFEVDAERHKIVRNEAQVLVLGPARQNFIANQQHGGSGNSSHNYLNQYLDICHCFSPLSKPCSLKAPLRAES